MFLFFFLIESIASQCFEQSKLINDNVKVIKSKPVKVELKKPIYYGFATLELSKLLMYDFHYSVIKKQCREKAKLLCTDTEGLYYEIETENIYDDKYQSF